MNKLLHKGYFKEIFRQLKVPGLVSAGVLMLGNFTGLLTMLSSIFGGMPGIPSGDALSLPIKPYIYIMGFLFPMLAFGWMNKRANSDFYHAIPVKRTQMYFSTVLAILAWMFIGIGAYALVKALLYLVSGLPFNYLLNLCVTINMLIACIEVVGAVSLACAISGTRFVNFAAALVILFMPRLLFTVLASFISAIQHGSLVVNKMSIFFDPTYNIIATPVSTLIGALFDDFNGGVSVNYAHVPAMLYTLAYSLLLVFLGYLAFKKRKSEAAGIPTTSSVFQHVIGICIGMPLLFVLDLLILQDDISGILISFFILIAFAFVFFCLYYLISTKSAKKTIASMPWFFVCLGIAVLFVFLPKLIVKSAEKVEVSPENVRGYYVVGTDEDNYPHIFDLGGYFGSSYNTLAASLCEFTDEESVKIISEAYARRNSPVSAMTIDMVVRIDRTNGRDITRRLSFTEPEMDQLKKLRLKNEQYDMAVKEFPKGRNYFEAGLLNRWDSKKLADALKAEIDSMSDEMKKAVNDGMHMMNNDTSAFINVIGCLGAENYSKVYYLDSTFTPNSLKLYYELLNKEYSDSAFEALDAVERWTKDGDREVNIYIDLNGMLGFTVNYWDLAYNTQQQTSDALPTVTDPEFCEFISILRRAEPTSDISGNTVLSISIYQYGIMNNKFNGDGYLSFKLSDGDMVRAEELIEIMREKFNSYSWYDESEWPEDDAMDH